MYNVTKTPPMYIIVLSNPKSALLSLTEGATPAAAAVLVFPLNSPPRVPGASHRLPAAHPAMAKQRTEL